MYFGLVSVMSSNSSNRAVDAQNTPEALGHAQLLELEPNFRNWRALPPVLSLESYPSKPFCKHG